VAELINKKAASFSDFLRQLFKGVLDPVGAFLNRLGITPDAMTLIGLAGNLFGAGMLAMGHISLGGMVVLLMGPLDALDGTMARLRGKTTRFGAFLDSVTDRYSELSILGGLLIYYIRQQNWLACGLIYLAAAGSVLVSYVKARAESLDFEAKVGILTRVERYIVLVPCLVINQPMIALWVIGLLANFTALQRIFHVWKQAHTPEPPQENQYKH
jgi:CDP-diacylglycerol--glycerol-3-phosphate 3-phosphatidyltransferase